MHYSVCFEPWQGQHTVDVKLDRIVKQMEEMKQRLKSLQQNTNTKLESVNADTGVQKKEIEMLEKE